MQEVNRDRDMPEPPDTGQDPADNSAPAARSSSASAGPPSFTGPGSNPVIPDHVLVRPIASGAYGEVWLARNAVRTPRAVKLVLRDQHASAESFEREFKGLQKFEPVSRSHAGLVDILTLGLLPDGAGFFYVMELADGLQGGREVDEATYEPATLRAVFKRRGALPADEVIRLGLMMAAALKHLHDEGLVHRDVKPSNILFVDGVPKLADAGLVAAVDDARSLVGTAGYVAPEGPGTPQADLYALGKVLYEAAFGKDRQDFPALPADLAVRPERERLLELNEIIASACAPDPRQRYVDAGEMLADLERLAAHGSVRRQRSLRRRLRIVGAVAAITSLAVASGVAWRSRSPAPSRSEPKTSAVGVEPMRGTTNIEAWNAVLRARFLEERLNRDDLRTALASWDRARTLDPGLVEAHLGWARTMTSLTWYAGVPANESYPKAQAAVLRALELEPRNVIGLTLLGYIKVIYGFEVREGERLLREALALAPDDPEVLGALSMCLGYQGHGSEAVELARRARALRPTSIRFCRNLGQRLVDARRFDEAIAVHQDTLLLAKDHQDIMVLLSEAYAFAGRTNEAFELKMKLREKQGTAPEELARLRAGFALVGLRAFETCDPPGSTNRTGGFAHPVGRAYNCVAAGDNESALQWLEKAFDEPLELVRIKSLPDFDPIRSDPRFQAILRKAGLD